MKPWSVETIALRELKEQKPQVPSLPLAGPLSMNLILIVKIWVKRLPCPLSTCSSSLPGLLPRGFLLSSKGNHPVKSWRPYLCSPSAPGTFAQVGGFLIKMAAGEERPPFQSAWLAFAFPTEVQCYYTLQGGF